MNKNTFAPQSGSAKWVKEELKKFTRVTDPKQVAKIRLYIGLSKLTESFKTFFVPTGIAAPEEVWASQTNPHFEWSEVYHIKIQNRNDWQLFDCPVCGHEIMLRTHHDIGTEIKTIPPYGECDYCKTKYPNQTIRKPQLGKRNAEYKATTDIGSTEKLRN
jgi:transcription elongation factor Elf1